MQEQNSKRSWKDIPFANALTLIVILLSLWHFSNGTNARIESVSERIDGTNARLESVNERIDGTNARIESVSERIDGTNARIESVSERIDGTNARIESVSERIDGTNARLDATNERIDIALMQLTELTDAQQITQASVENFQDDLDRVVKRQSELEAQVQLINDQ